MRIRVRGAVFVVITQIQHASQNNSAFKIFPTIETGDEVHFHLISAADG